MSTFHYFLRLPRELQRRIWELTSKPREIDLRGGHEVNGTRLCMPFDTRQPPVALHVCRSSRELLAHPGGYIRLPADRVRDRDLRSLTRVYIWMNPSEETIRVMDCCMKQLSRNPWAARLRRVAIDISDWWEFWLQDYQRITRPRIPLLGGDFPRLKEVQLCVHGSWFDPEWRDRVRSLTEALYATCRPVPVDFRVRFLIYDRLAPPTRHNYGRVFLLDDITEWLLFGWLWNFSKPVAYIPKWRHRNCNCPIGANPGVYKLSPRDSQLLWWMPLCSPPFMR